MSNTIIEVSKLCKSFPVSSDNDLPQHPDTFRDAISVTAKKILTLGRKSREQRAAAKEVFHALTDVSFSIEQGHRVGIIGRNGAGKSTLLKILSRITAPTSGTVDVRGRVVSLLEVGTGFHPELSGRENVFLNGVILGMKRNDIKKKFDQIVGFAEIEKFLDMPVKKYSSGMYMRLAFAVASHMEPEILIIDEMLAVGDAHFQKKCLTRMEEISKEEGRTILFVSHSIDAVRMLCDKAIFLNKGQVAAEGDIKSVINAYVDSYYEKRTGFAPDPHKPVHFSSVKLASEQYEFGSDLILELMITSDRVVDQYAIGLGISNNLDARAGSSLLFNEQPLKKGDNFITIRLPLNTIVPGEYKLAMAIAVNDMQEILDTVLDYPSFTIVPDEANRYLFSKWQPSFSDNILNAVIV